MKFLKVEPVQKVGSIAYLSVFS